MHLKVSDFASPCSVQVQQDLPQRGGAERAGLQGVQQGRGHLRLELRRGPRHPGQARPEVVHLRGGRALPAWHEAQRHRPSGNASAAAAGPGAVRSSLSALPVQVVVMDMQCLHGCSLQIVQELLLRHPDRATWCVMSVGRVCSCSTHDFFLFLHFLLQK